METLDLLSKKVHLAADELLSLKKERRQILSELELLRHQSHHYQAVVRDNDRLKKDHDRLRSRLVKMQKKIERLLVMETPALSPLGGKANEEHPQ